VWIVRGLVLLVGVICILWLGTRNAGTKVTYHFFTKTFVDAELNLVMVITFLCGMLVWAIGAWIREAQLLMNILNEKKTIRRLKDELSDLRNLPLEDDTLDEDKD
jgi:hypothetical protein